MEIKGTLMKMINVLIVDDSAFMRREIKKILEADPDICVIGASRNGADALEDIEKYSPDVITLDINMPVMDGLTCLTHIKSKWNIPVVMLSSLTKEGELTTFEALELGAVDFVGKPGGTVSRNIKEVEDEIRYKVKGAAGAILKNIKTRKTATTKKAPRIKLKRASLNLDFHKTIVVIGVSTGGPKTLFEILPLLPKDINFGIVIVQHMPPSFTANFAKRINDSCAFPFKEAKTGEDFEVGTGYLAPGGSHLTFTSSSSSSTGFKMRLSKFPSNMQFTPSVDIMFKSAAQAFKNNCLGVLLTGMGNDGAEGMVLIKENGGQTIAEAEESCIVFGMPKVAIELGAADYILHNNEIANKIYEI